MASSGGAHLTPRPTSHTSGKPQVSLMPLFYRRSHKAFLWCHPMLPFVGFRGGYSALRDKSIYPFIRSILSSNHMLLLHTSSLNCTFLGSRRFIVCLCSSSNVCSFRLRVSPELKRSSSQQSSHIPIREPPGHELPVLTTLSSLAAALLSATCWSLSRPSVSLLLSGHNTHSFLLTL